VKVLVAHNRYRSTSPSGENKLVDDEIGILRAAGVDVVTMIEESDRLDSAGIVGLAEAAVGPVYAPAGVRRFRELLLRERPDVVHLHNVYPLISPQVIRVSGERRVPVVQTMHNYRHSCVNGLQFRDGAVCTDCDGSRLSLPAIKHGCYRGSRAQTLPMAIGRSVHRSTWAHVDRFLALTPFMARRLALNGIDEQRITVRPSWVRDPGPGSPRGNDFVYVGRLDEAKGIPLLLKAWQHTRSSRRLVVVGSGPLAGAVEAAASSDPSIVYLGQQGAAGVAAAIGAASAVVVPSLWFEGFPLTVVEAFAHGRPVVVLEGGSAASVVDDRLGWRVARSHESLSDLLGAWDSGEADRRGRAARAAYEALYSPAAAMASLMQVYGELTGRVTVVTR
jgi:glycosyltransferase involved in cell wall biosynthesis